MSDLKFLFRHYVRLSEPLLATMLHGIRVDRIESARLLTDLQTQLSSIQLQLAELAGVNTCTCGHRREAHIALAAPVVMTKAGKPKKRQPPPTYPCRISEQLRARDLPEIECACTDFTALGQSLHGKKDLSSSKVIDFIYARLGFPKHRKRGAENPSADEVILRKLLLKAQALQIKPLKRLTPTTPTWRRDPDLAVNALTLLLQHREKAKLATYLDPKKVDEDGRIRSMMKVTTESGRLATSRNPYGSGYNIQNIPRAYNIRGMFVPDYGCVFLECDYSQIEDRIVKVLSKDPEMIRQARTRPGEFDAHSAGAKRIFSKVLGIPEDEIDVKAFVTPGNTRRQIAKPIRHGVNYGEGAKKIQEGLLKEGVILPLSMCEALLNAARERPILDFQRETRKRIMRDRVLTNSWGRRLDFTGERLVDETYRRGYAFRGSSENADNLNQLGFVPLFNYIASGEAEWSMRPDSIANIDDYLNPKRSAFLSRINCQVHDSLLVSCPVDEIYSIASFLKVALEREREYEGVELAVPVEFKTGSSWLCEKSYKELPSRKVLEGDAEEILNHRRRAA